jgi:hypothetical protein
MIGWSHLADEISKLSGQTDYLKIPPGVVVVMMMRKANLSIQKFFPEAT